MLTSKLEAVLEEPATGWDFEAVERAAGFALDPERRAALSTWLGELCVWNARMDLTAAKTADELTELMVTDALVLATMIPTPGSARVRVVDVGTGAGAPGLALAIARPDLALTLVDPLGKRIAFLRTVLGRLRRADVALVTGRGDSLPRGAFDVAISRATLAPADWLDLGRTLVSSAGGEVYVLLSDGDGDEAPDLETREYSWPFSGRVRRIVRHPVGVVPSPVP